MINSLQLNLAEVLHKERYFKLGIKIEQYM
jgi:hypothetical protein